MPQGRVQRSLLPWLAATLAILCNANVGEGVCLVSRLPRPFQSHYADGTRTQDIGAEFLPRCTLQLSDDEDAVIELVNNSTAAVVAVARNGYDSDLLWSFAEHPLLNSSHTGVYVCRSSLGQYSHDTYTLSVVEPVSICLPEHVVAMKGSLTIVSCTATGYPLSGTRLSHGSHGSALVISKRTSVLGDWKEHTSCMVFPGGLPEETASTEVTCTARLLDFPCTPGSQSSVQQRCQSVQRFAEKHAKVHSVSKPRSVA